MNGQGYQLLGNKIDFELQSSNKKDSPEDTQASYTRPIHIELYKGLFDSEMFLKVKMSAQIVFSGLRIDTKRSKALQSFYVRYVRRSIQYSGVMEDIMVH